MEAKRSLKPEEPQPHRQQSHSRTWDVGSFDKCQTKQFKKREDKKNDWTSLRFIGRSLTRGHTVLSRAIFEGQDPPLPGRAAGDPVRQSVTLPRRAEELIKLGYQAELVNGSNKEYVAGSEIRDAKGC
jgi:hypothetical protein